MDSEMSVGCLCQEKEHRVAQEALLSCPSSTLWSIHMDTDTMNQEIGIVSISCDQGDLIHARHNGKRNICC